jgi:hypothetical protein
MRSLLSWASEMDSSQIEIGCETLTSSFLQGMLMPEELNLCLSIFGSKANLKQMESVLTKMNAQPGMSGRFGTLVTGFTISNSSSQIEMAAILQRLSPQSENLHMAFAEGLAKVNVPISSIYNLLPQELSKRAAGRIAGSLIMANGFENAFTLFNSSATKEHKEELFDWTISYATRLGEESVKNSLQANKDPLFQTKQGMSFAEANPKAAWDLGMKMSEIQHTARSSLMQGAVFSTARQDPDAALEMLRSVPWELRGEDKINFLNAVHDGVRQTKAKLTIEEKNEVLDQVNALLGRTAVAK